MRELLADRRVEVFLGDSAAGNWRNTVMISVCCTMVGAVVAASVVRRRNPSDAQDAASADKVLGGTSPYAACEGSPKQRSPGWSGPALLLVVVGAGLMVIGAALALSPHITSAPPSSHRHRQFVEWCTPATSMLGAYGDLGNYTFPIHTSSPLAQEYFNQGLVLAFAFTREEALRNFELAIFQDPTCAMCHWGASYALGPNINLLAGPTGTPYPHWSAAERKRALRFATSAMDLAAAARRAHPESIVLEREYQYIQAIELRYEAGADSADSAYVAAMEHVVSRFQSDADAKALLAEAMMIPISWDYYDPDGSPKSATSAIVRLLETCLSVHARHPLALHLHVHVTEAGIPGPSSHPREPEWGAARGESSANQLAGEAGAVPGSGHMVHMAGHNFIRVGRYRDAANTNVLAADNDRRYAASCLAPYLPEHNLNLLVFAASMAGMRELATSAARRMRRVVHLTARAFKGGADHATLLWVLIRFGNWQEVELSGPLDSATRLRDPAYAKFAWEAARLFVLANHAAHAPQLQLQPYVFAAQRLLQAAFNAVPEDVKTKPGPGNGIYASHNRAVSGIALRVANARVLLLRDMIDEAVRELELAVEMQDNLTYMEPPYVHAPVRQCLGRVLLVAGRLLEAEAVYREDLKQYPLNGWSLLGLSHTLQQQGRYEEASEFEHLQNLAWSAADVVIDSSCPAFEKTAYMLLPHHLPNIDSGMSGK